MFEQSTLPSAPASKRLWATCLGITGEAILVGCAILAPMLWPQVLPRTTLITSLLPPVPQPPPPKHESQPQPKTRVIRMAAIYPNVLYQPVRYPDKPQILVDPPPEVASGSGVIGGVERGTPGGVEGGVLDSILKSGAPPAPRPRVEEPRHAAVVAAAPIKVRQVRPGGVVKMAEVVRRVEPQYPAIARQMRVSGVVELVGVIAIDGHLKELRLVSGHPLLARAAMEAVSQWLYEPTTLNGEPVEVIAPITVTFRLN